MSISIALYAGPLQEAAQQALADLTARNIIARISAREQPDEIDNRLGWLDCPQKMPSPLGANVGAGLKKIIDTLDSTRN